MKKALFVLLLVSACLYASESEDPVRKLLSNDPDSRRDAAEQILRSKNKRYIPSLLELAFYFTFRKDVQAYESLQDLLLKLSGEKSPQRYFGWLQWVGAHSEIKPLPEYFLLKREIFGLVDPAFASFLSNEKSFRIRPEEIVWGGVKKDGIPALKNPPHIRGAEATYLKESDKVFGVAVGGDYRAYPLRIMDWHEMANDEVGGLPVSLSYCTLCGSAILYSGKVGDKTFTFGSSGLLYRSNKLMYDHNTESLWSELQGEPVAGKLVDQGIRLEILPVVLSTWGEWKRRHPETTVLSLSTGYQRDYNVEPYKQYFESKELMFPVPVLNDRLAPKDFVFVLRAGTRSKAYPLDLLLKKGLVVDRVGDKMVALVGDSNSKSVRAYNCRSNQVDLKWQALEDHLVSPDCSQKCSRLPGHLAYWFGWYAQFPNADLYEE